MENLDILKLLGQSGIAVGALIILGRIVWQVGQRMIEAIDRIGIKLDDHTKADINALAEVSKQLAVLQGRMEVALGTGPRDEWSERTPVGGTPIPRYQSAAPVEIQSEPTGRVGGYRRPDRSRSG